MTKILKLNISSDTSLNYDAKMPENYQTNKQI